MWVASNPILLYRKCRENFNMKLTATQETILKDLGMCGVKYTAMHTEKGQLGYTTRGRRGYDITIASDIDPEIQNVVLMHEVGHVYLGHMDAPIKIELENIKKILDSKQKSISSLMYYGGPMSFINIAMDLEVNTKVLTLSNVDALKNAGFEGCTLENQKVEFKRAWYEYYESLIDNIPEDTSDPKDQSINMDIPSTENDDDLDQWLNSLPENAANEIREALEKEGYEDGNSQDKMSGNTKPNITVDDMVDDMASDNPEGQGIAEAKEEEQEKSGKGFGQGRSNKNIEITANTSEEIKRFLKSIVSHKMTFKLDPIRHYNRGTRRSNSGLLYNSQRRKMDVSKKKLGILVDISGSMDTSKIILAASSMKDCDQFLDPSSKLVTWDTHLDAEYKLDRIPSHIHNGGGTDIAAGLKYLSKQGFTDIVIFSDFETYIDDLIEEAKLSPAKIYSIIVDRNEKYFDSQDKEYFNKYCTKNILLS